MAEVRARQARDAELLSLDALERHSCATLESVPLTLCLHSTRWHVLLQSLALATPAREHQHLCLMCEKDCEFSNLLVAHYSTDVTLCRALDLNARGGTKKVPAPYKRPQRRSTGSSYSDRLQQVGPCTS